MIIGKKIIYDKNTDGTDYLINLNNGAKYELYFIGTKCVLCGDEITKNDVIRASQNDRVDIKNLLTKKVNEDEMKNFKKLLEKFLLRQNSIISKKITEIIK